MSINRLFKKQQVKRNLKTTLGVLISDDKVNTPKREREVLGIKSEEAQKARNHLNYWKPERILNKFELGDFKTIDKHGRGWYEDIKLCVRDIPSFKFKEYYNVMILLCTNGTITKEEFWEVFDLASHK